MKDNGVSGMPNKFRRPRDDATVEELAAAERINASYVSRVLRLTLLAPDIVEAILDGRQPAEMTLVALMRPFAVGWHERAPGDRQKVGGESPLQ